MRNFYKNPMSQTFCYEYALYEMLSDLFAGTSCNSMLIGTLRMYYSDLVKENDHKHNPYAPVTFSYEKQYVIEEKINYLIARDVVGKVTFPGMHLCRAEVKVRTMPDGSHAFLFTDGIYAFEAMLAYGKKGAPAAVLVRNLKSAAAPSAAPAAGAAKHAEVTGAGAAKQNAGPEKAPEKSGKTANGKDRETGKDTDRADGKKPRRVA